MTTLECRATLRLVRSASEGAPNGIVKDGMKGAKEAARKIVFGSDYFSRVQNDLGKRSAAGRVI